MRAATAPAPGDITRIVVFAVTRRLVIQETTRYTGGCSQIQEILPGWLRLYQARMQGLVPCGGDAPLWWTLRRPFRPLGYHAARRMFERANAVLRANWTLHDLRHSAAYRMARDPRTSLTDVRWVLGHSQLTTTQIYLSPVPEDVIASVLAHHSRRSRGEGNDQDEAAAPTYRAESLNVLFGQGTA